MTHAHHHHHAEQAHPEVVAGAAAHTEAQAPVVPGTSEADKLAIQAAKEAQKQRDAELAAQKKADKERVAAEKKAAKDAEKAEKQAAADAKKAERDAAKAEKQAAADAKKAERESKAAEKAQAKADKEANRQPEQNGVRRPGPDTLCGKAWALADAMSEEMGSPVPVATLVERGEAEGLNPGNIRTEYSRWRKFHNLQGMVIRPVKVAPEAAAETPAA